MTDLDFVQVGELAKGIRQEGEPAVGELAGTSLELHDEAGVVTRLVFTGVHELAWEVLRGPDAGSSGAESYAAFSPRDGIFLVDYISSMLPRTSISMVLDRTTGSATVVVGTLPTVAEVEKGAFALARDGEELTAVRARFVRTAIDRPFTADGHAHVPTGEMVGKRVRYAYGPTEVYEHIYLNEKLYTWQCLAGVEKGLADTDRCHAFKLGDGLYLFVWRERVVPTLGVVVVDWREMRSFGKLCGYESSDFGAVANARIASVATLLNVTEHDPASF
jgi:MoaF C-terminal domain/MoaF N-terminal domain